jgi:outer membrane protein
MKKFVLFFALGLLLGITNLKAQTVKLGYVNSQELLQLMPEVSKADTALKVYAKSFQDQLDAMSKEYDKKVKEFQDSEKTMSDAVKEVKYKEIQQLQERMQSTNESAQEKVSTKRQELYKPLLEKADKAIKDVAKEKGYSYVFDASAGTLLFANDSDNILPLVKAKLGIK